MTSPPSLTVGVHITVWELLWQHKEGSLDSTYARGHDVGASWWHANVVMSHRTKYHLLCQTQNHAWIGSNRKLSLISFPGVVAVGWSCEIGTQIRSTNELNYNGTRTTQSWDYDRETFSRFFLCFAEPHLDAQEWPCPMPCPLLILYFIYFCKFLFWCNFKLQKRWEEKGTLM